MALDAYKITDAERTANYVGSAPDKLSGTVAQNKNIFDKYADLIRTKFDNFVEYVGTHVTTEGDAALDIDAVSVASLCTALECNPSDIEMD